MTSRRALAQTATVAALRVRRELDRQLEYATCPFDLARALGLDVRFVAAPSLEGLYIPAKSTIVVGSLRPRGRRSFTCAHEIGHHVFRHGFRVDEVDAAEYDDAEFVANRFAAALLMPKLAVDRAFAVRGTSAATCTAQALYSVAGYLGVGYTTLLGHLEYTLRLVSTAHAKALRVPLERVRKTILGFVPPKGLFIVEEHWIGRSVDVDVGDMVILPKGTLVDADILKQLGSHAQGLLLQAVRPGCATARSSSWKGSLRVGRAGYEGRAQYRYLGEEDDDA
ncbi:MAG: ImmA/IrrE family metallo-endopeptidase [Polyangiaceae bacterium]